MNTEITRTQSYKPVAHTPARAQEPEQTRSAPPVAQKTESIKAAQKALTQEQQAQLKKAVELLNEQMKSHGNQLSFSVDESLNRTVIQVANAKTGEVIRQIPNEAALRVSENIEKFKGLLLDESR